MWDRVSNELRRRKYIWTNRLFPFFETFGFHVTPVHYYEPIPDTRKLKESLWTERSELVGVDMNERKQLELLSLFSSKYKNEYDAIPSKKTSVPYQFTFENPSFGPVDAEVLYCMIRHFKPRRIFEVGSGHSTYLSAQAVLKNKSEGHDCELVSFEPYPNEILRAGFPGLSSVRQVKIEDVPLSEFQALGENDILFIDSSHVVRIGGDVKHLFLEVVPRLKRGVLVHVHDIFLPAEYPRQWVMKRRQFWSEQYLLQALLMFNSKFEVLWAGGYAHLKHPEKLEAAFGSYERETQWPGSIWIRRAQ